jgi:hypothetical protein
MVATISAAIETGYRSEIFRAVRCPLTESISFNHKYSISLGILNGREFETLFGHVESGRVASQIPTGQGISPELEYILIRLIDNFHLTASMGRWPFWVALSGEYKREGADLHLA